MTEGEVIGAPKPDELVGEVQDAPVEAAKIEAEEAAKLEVAKLEAALEAAKAEAAKIEAEKAAAEAKFDAWLGKLKKIAADATKNTPAMPKPVEVKKGEKAPPVGPQVNVFPEVGHFTNVVKALNGRRCPNSVRTLLAREGEWKERGEIEFAANNRQNAIDHAKRADELNRRDAVEDELNREFVVNNLIDQIHTEVAKV